jgi:hypothetical protein
MPSEDKLKETVFFVEATDYERHEIWRKLHVKHDYEHDNMGFSQHIGNIKNDPSMGVHVCFLFSYLYGYRICMYNATSRFVDHTMVEEYIKTNWPVKWDNGNRIAMCDANNMHLCVNAVDDLVKQKEKENGATA